MPPPHTHTYDGGVVTKETTCTEEGVVTYTCTAGDDSYKEPIPMLEHLWSQWADAGDGTHTRSCTIGGEGEREDHIPGGQWEVADGKHWRTCTACAAELDRAGHTYEDGVCIVCGAARPPAPSPAPETAPVLVYPTYSLVEMAGVKKHTIFTGAVWTKAEGEEGQVIAKWAVCPSGSDTPVAEGEQDVLPYSAGVEVDGLTAGDSYTIKVTMVYRLEDADYEIEGIEEVSTDFTALDPDAPEI